MRRRSLGVLAVVSHMLLFCSAASWGGSFFETQSADSTHDLIFHPNSYSGVGGDLTVTVCIDPTSAFRQESIAPFMRAIATWDALVATNDNLNPTPEVPPGQVDFESIALHELGHCLGLGHPNLNLFGTIVTGFTNAGEGVNGVHNIDNGEDNIAGSADDIRSDDANVMWFRKADNNPFAMGGVIDATSYSRDLADLPVDDEYATNANNSVANNIFGFSNGRAVMSSGFNAGVEQRQLAPDDVATLRLGMSGVDEIEGTADDYTIELAFLGKSQPCQIMLSFEPLGNGDLGVCSLDGAQSIISGRHVRLGPLMKIRLNTTPDLGPWFFGDSPDLTITATDGGLSADAGDSVAYTIEVANVGQIDPTSMVEIVATVPDNTTFDVGNSSAEWDCMGSTSAGSPCLIQLPAITAGSPAMQFSFGVVVDDPLMAGVAEIEFSAQITAAGGDANPGDNFTSDVTPITPPGEILADDFESGDLSQWDTVVP